jgi:hypothetical protein
MMTLRDLARAMAAAGGAAVAEGTTVTALRLRVPMLVRVVPQGDALWDMALHHHAHPRAAPLWLLRWRRLRRRRRGWVPSAIELHWNRYGVVACRDMRRLATLSPAALAAMKGSSR